MNVGDIRFRTRGVTPEEKAAVQVVLDAVIDEESAEEHAVTGGRQSAWQKSQRSMRDEVGLSVNFGVDYPN